MADRCDIQSEVYICFCLTRENAGLLRILYYYAICFLFRGFRKLRGIYQYVFQQSYLRVMVNNIFS